MPRYATSPNQNRLLARKGPYFNAFYAYGGIRSDMQTAMAVASKWKEHINKTQELLEEQTAVLYTQVLLL